MGLPLQEVTGFAGIFIGFCLFINTEGHAYPFPYQLTSQIQNFPTQQPLYDGGIPSTSSTYFTRHGSFAKFPLKSRFNVDNALGYNLHHPRQRYLAQLNVEQREQGQQVQSQQNIQPQGTFDPNQGVNVGPVQRTIASIDPFHAGGRVLSLLSNPSPTAGVQSLSQVNPSENGGIGTGGRFIVGNNNYGPLPTQLTQQQPSTFTYSPQPQPEQNQPTGPVQSNAPQYVEQQPSISNNNNNNVNVVYNDNPSPVVSNLQREQPQQFDQNIDFSPTAPPTLSVLDAHVIRNENTPRVTSSDAAPLQNFAPMNTLQFTQTSEPVLKNPTVGQNNAVVQYGQNAPGVNKPVVQQNSGGGVEYAQNSGVNVNQNVGQVNSVLNQNAPVGFSQPILTQNSLGGNQNGNSYFQPQPQGQQQFHQGQGQQQLFQAQGQQQFPQPQGQQPFPHGGPGGPFPPGGPGPYSQGGQGPFPQGGPGGPFPQGGSFPQGGPFPQGGSGGPFPQGGPGGPFPQGGPSGPFPQGGPGGPFPEPENGYNPNHLQSFPEPPYESEFAGLPGLSAQDSVELEAYLTKLRAFNEAQRRMSSTRSPTDALGFRIVNMDGNSSSTPNTAGLALSPEELVNAANSKPVPSKCAYNTITQGVQAEDCIEIR